VSDRSNEGITRLEDIAGGCALRYWMLTRSIGGGRLLVLGFGGRRNLGGGGNWRLVKCCFLMKAF
jgi:hypothetical protein